MGCSVSFVRPHLPRARPSDLKEALSSSEAIAARLDEIERKIDRLRALYESFFMGTERRPPNVPRRELNRLMLELQQITINNAGLRFRFQALLQRWTLLTTYWNRTLREIESGTYRRDLERAYRRLASRGEPLTESEAVALGIPMSRARAFVAQQNRRWSIAGPSAADAPRPESAGGPSLPSKQAAAIAERTGAAQPEVDFSQLYASYLDAHAALGLQAAPLDESRLRASVASQIAALAGKQASGRFKLLVVAQDGRLRLRARPVTPEEPARAASRPGPGRGSDPGPGRRPRSRD